MYSRSLFIKLDKLNIASLSDAIVIREYIETCICYIAKKILVDNSYTDYMDVRYNYCQYKIDNSFNIIEQVEILPHLRQDLFTLIDIFNKNIEEAINNFYHQRKNNFSVLNINSMLVNADTILITYEYFE